jgi:hypothetical protein
MDHDAIRRLLAELQIPYEVGPVLGIWAADTASGWEVHLGPPTFWRLVTRLGVEVRSTVYPQLLHRHCHRLTHAGVDFLTYSAEPVLPPGSVTRGYALELT